MFKDKIRLLRDFVMRNNKIVFSVVGVLAVALTVFLALGAVSKRKVKDIVPPSSEPTTEVSQTEDVPLVLNEDTAVTTLISDFFAAQADGDLEKLKSLCDEISDLDLLSYEEKAKYIDAYPMITIYTKKGLHEGECIAYVYYRMTFANHAEEFPGYTSHYICKREDGSLYIKRTNFSDELNEYASVVCSQDDVVEFNNRVIAEYDSFKEAHPDLAGYPEEVMAQVNMTVGVRWSELQNQVADSGDASDGDVSGNDVADNEPKYAVTTDTVNIRTSDSIQADRLGKVSKGTKLEVLEVRPNGWTKVKYESKEGFINSEYLSMEKPAESADGVATTGTLTATTNVNVRSAADENSEKLGKLLGGESVELIAREGDWCKVKFQGKVGYVKAEYLQ